MYTQIDSRKKGDDEDDNGQKDHEPTNEELSKTNSLSEDLHADLHDLEDEEYDYFEEK